jgi:flagellin-specific chaperone FliS
MDDYHFNNIAKKIKELYLVILGKIKAWNFRKNGHILSVENKILKDLMNVFFELTLNLQRF